MQNKILEALENIPVADLTRQDWISVGIVSFGEFSGGDPGRLSGVK